MSLVHRSTYYDGDLISREGYLTTRAQQALSHSEESLTQDLIEEAEVAAQHFGWKQWETKVLVGVQPQDVDALLIRVELTRNRVMGAVKDLCDDTDG